MKFLRWLNSIAVLSFLSACGTGGGGIPIFSTDTPLPPPVVNVSPAPDPNTALQAYLEAFKADDYNTMYSLVSKVTQDTVTLEDFAKRNRDSLNEMSAGSFEYEILSALVNPYSAEVAYRVTYKTALVGDIQRDMIAKLALEGDQWKLNWDDSLILPELAGGNVLKMNYNIPSRGNIYDHNGNALAAQSKVYAFYVIPGNVTDESVGALISQAFVLCGTSQDGLAEAIYTANISGASQYPIPLCEASEEESSRIRAVYPSGLEWSEYETRYYFNQGTGSNIVGYTKFISEEEMESYRRKGYNVDERVGADGIERWAEDYLRGKQGGELYVINPAGNIVTKVGESEPKPADSVYLTIDQNLQYYTEQAIKGFTGAAVVLERDTGRVLAMASSPSYDSNIFAADNPNGSSEYSELLQANQPFLNRATQGQYPLGSVFKLITLAAGMESGLFEPGSTWDCQYEWIEIPGEVRNDWTWQHCQDRLARGQECNTSDSQPSGLLNLSEGLMRSCNPFFWHIAYILYQNNRSNDIANMARGFGLGSLTGIEQILEEPGRIPDPTSVIDVVNQSIGQGDVQVTPLQVARFIAALGNGGTLYRPQLVEQIVPVEGAATTIFEPIAQGTLPIQPFRLDFIQDAMIRVVKDPLGTAYFRLRGLQIPVAGKTGTAESGVIDPHAWFAGYTMASESTGLPDIAIAVVLENQGEGSDYAAPVFKRIVETYYYGEPRTLYWFESSFGVTETPTPLGGIPTETSEP
ncbi:MAG TPA: penicillin-binding transpeptidase domain-containing protein [Anaerolineales bacterium]|nr:penicillin-binding transpeptidase domain-containing protein [Anaerolineales bacterium]